MVSDCFIHVPRIQGQQCALALVEHCGTERLLEALVRLLAARRQGRSMELLAVALRRPACVGRHLELVEEVVSKGLKDASGEVRAKAREAFWVFEEGFQELKVAFREAVGWSSGVERAVSGSNRRCQALFQAVGSRSGPTGC